ncbi:MAG: flagellar biosynthetic protein FliQ [Acidimicrobiales bacterium]
MNDTTIVQIVVQTMWVTAKLAGPILVVSLAVGFLVSLVQSATMIQEFTLSFVPKLIAVGAVIVVAGNWMLEQLIAFTRDLFAMVPMLVGT